MIEIIRLRKKVKILSLVCFVLFVLLIAAVYFLNYKEVELRKAKENYNDCLIYSLLEKMDGLKDAYEK